MNKYLVASGVVSVLLALAHTAWGWMNIYGDVAQLSAIAGASLEGAFLQVGATLLVGGIALVVHGVRREMSNAVPLLILAIYAVNFVIGLSLVIAKYPSLLDQTAPQLILYSSMFSLLLLGIKTNRNNIKHSYFN
ncbi:MAG: hypothetical protein PHQ60_01290 [Sideroxydans sp.]|nr:hypothetical protein [Sideroxydans sp.]